MRQLTMTILTLLMTVYQIEINAQDLTPNIPPDNINVLCHCEGKGDIGPIMEGLICTHNDDSRLEGFQINRLGNKIPKLIYQARLNGTGMTPWISDGQFCGTKGQSRMVEGIAIKFETDNPFYSVSYRLKYNSSSIICWGCTTEVKGHDGQFVSPPNNEKVVGLLIYITKKETGTAITPTSNKTPCPQGVECVTDYGIDVREFGGQIFFRPADSGGTCTKNLAWFPKSDLIDMKVHSSCNHPIENKMVTVYSILHKKN